MNSLTSKDKEYINHIKSELEIVMNEKWYDIDKENNSYIYRDSLLEKSYFQEAIDNLVHDLISDTQTYEYVIDNHVIDNPYVNEMIIKKLYNLAISPWLIKRAARLIIKNSTQLIIFLEIACRNANLALILEVLSYGISYKTENDDIQTEKHLVPKNLNIIAEKIGNLKCEYPQEELSIIKHLALHIKNSNLKLLEKEAIFLYRNKFMHGSEGLDIFINALDYDTFESWGRPGIYSLTSFNVSILSMVKSLNMDELQIQNLCQKIRLSQQSFPDFPQLYWLETTAKDYVLGVETRDENSLNQMLALLKSLMNAQYIIDNDIDNSKIKKLILKTMLSFSTKQNEDDEKINKL